MASIQLSVLIPTPRRTPRQRVLLCSAAGLSLLACVAVLPMVWNLLTLLHTLPHWGLLQRVLAHSPMTAWLLMLAWGAAVPLCLLATLFGGLHWRGALITVGALLLAVVWYMHMPALQQCSVLYGMGGVCRLLQAVYPLSLGLAVAVYLFGLVVLLLSGLGLVSLVPSDEDPLNRDRYHYGV